MAWRRRASTARFRALPTRPARPLRRSRSLGERASAHRPRTRRPGEGRASSPMNGFPDRRLRSRPGSSGALLPRRLHRSQGRAVPRVPRRRARQSAPTTMRRDPRGVPHPARKAVTREGQVRSGERHDKDDRHRVDDPRRWVLGWANERKIAALRAEVDELEAETGTGRTGLRRGRREPWTRPGAARSHCAIGGIPVLGGTRRRRGRARANSYDDERAHRGRLLPPRGDHPGDATQHRPIRRGRRAKSRTSPGT